MLRRVSESLLRLSSAWTLTGVTAVYAWFIARVMPAQSAASSRYAGEWGAPDRHFFYTPEALYAAVATWGVEGSADYIGFRLGMDIAWALAYTAFLVLAIGCATRIAFGEQDRRRLLNLVPLLTLLLDYTENALGIFLVSTFPQRHDGIAWLAALVTSGKWLTLVAAHGVLVYALACAIRLRLRSR